MRNVPSAAVRAAQADGEKAPVAASTLHTSAPATGRPASSRTVPKIVDTLPTDTGDLTLGTDHEHSRALSRVVPKTNLPVGDIVEHRESVLIRPGRARTTKKVQSADDGPGGPVVDEEEEEVRHGKPAGAIEEANLQ